MSDSTENKSLDILGVKPIANAVEKVTDGAVDGARAFLSRICLPAAEEFGLLLQDSVKSWRASRAASLAKKAEAKVLQNHGSAKVTLAPRIAHQVFDDGSWIEDEQVHSMWAGLLASACNENGGDDSNIVFISLLKQLTSPEVRILRFLVEQAEKYVSPSGWPVAIPFTCTIYELLKIAEIDDAVRLDRELDHLQSLDLIRTQLSGPGVIESHSKDAEISPSPLALNLYVRAEGFPGSPTEFWALKEFEVPSEE